jgi:peptidoglycan/xylan/chitin deacetylase (PgdA/CDA1 family)
MTDIRPDRVAFHVESGEPEIVYALRTLILAAGAVPVEATRDEAQVFHGHAEPSTARLWIRAATRPGPNWVVDAMRRPTLPLMGFDIARVGFALLSDEVNADAAADDHDEHGRLRRDATWQARQGRVLSPAFNSLVQHFREALEGAGIARSFLPLWPEGRRCAVGLSHDVDSPDKYPMLSLLRYNPGRVATSPATALRVIRAGYRRTFDRASNDRWQFDAILEEERRRGFRSTFFFAATSRQDPRGSVHDVDYQIGWPHFRQAIARILDAGWEVGLHAGYLSCQLQGQFEVEKRSLEALTGRPTRGLRHHFWHLGADPDETLRAHESAGFEFDCSIAFNDLPGFRANIGLPFHPWHRGRRQAISTLQLPTMCMDGNYFYRSDDVDAAVHGFSELLGELRAAEGFGSIDWHARASVPASSEYRSWGTAYLRILDLLAGSSDVWVTTMADAYDWWSARERLLLSGQN